MESYHVITCPLLMPLLMAGEQTEEHGPSTRKKTQKWTIAGINSNTEVRNTSTVRNKTWTKQPHTQRQSALGAMKRLETC